MQIVLFGFRLVLERFPRYAVEIYREKTDGFETPFKTSSLAAAREYMAIRVESLAKGEDLGYKVQGQVIDSTTGNYKGDCSLYVGIETTYVEVRTGLSVKK